MRDIALRVIGIGEIILTALYVVDGLECRCAETAYAHITRCDNGAVAVNALYYSVFEDILFGPQYSLVLENSSERCGTIRGICCDIIDLHAVTGHNGFFCKIKVEEYAVSFKANIRFKRIVRAGRICAAGSSYHIIVVGITGPCFIIVIFVSIVKDILDRELCHSLFALDLIIADNELPYNACAGNYLSGLGVIYISVECLISSFYHSGSDSAVLKNGLCCRYDRLDRLIVVQYNVVSFHFQLGSIFQGNFEICIV